MTGLLFTVIGALAVPGQAQADGRYYNSDRETQTNHMEWMGWLPDSILLRDISIPGTHLSNADQEYFDFDQTQGLSVAAQLNSGIRALNFTVEIGCLNDGDSEHKSWKFEFESTDVPVFLAGSIFPDYYSTKISKLDACKAPVLREGHFMSWLGPRTPVDLKASLASVATFLAEHPTETVIIHLAPLALLDFFNKDGYFAMREEFRSAYERDFLAALDNYMFITAGDEIFFANNAGGNLEAWNPGPGCDVDAAKNITLGDVRGKIVYMTHGRVERSFTLTGTNTGNDILLPCRGIDIGSMHVDGRTLLVSTPVLSVDGKWQEVEQGLILASKRDQQDLRFSLHWLSDGFPTVNGVDYVGCDLMEPDRDYSLANGAIVINGIKDAYEIVCDKFTSFDLHLPYVMAGAQPLLVDGINKLTLNHLLKKEDNRPIGILMMDFPGPALIDAIIAQNLAQRADPDGNRLSNEIAAEFPLMFNNIAYNGTDIGGSQQALDRNKLLSLFFNRKLQRIPGTEANFPIMMDGSISVFTYIDPAFCLISPCTPTEIGYAVTHQGLFKETDWIDTDNIFETRSYKSVGFSNYAWLKLPPATYDAMTDFVDNWCVPTVAATNANADGLRSNLNNLFPGIAWNVLIKRGAGGFDNWAYAMAGNKYDTGGSNARCVVWGYPYGAPGRVPGNAAPAFESDALLSAVRWPVNIIYAPIVASDAEGDDLTIWGEVPAGLTLTETTCDGAGTCTAYLLDPVEATGDQIPGQGNHYFTLNVTDSNGPAPSKEFLVKVNEVPVWLDGAGNRVKDDPIVSPSNPPIEITSITTDPYSQRWTVQAIDPNGDPIAIFPQGDLSGSYNFGCGVPPDWMVVQRQRGRLRVFVRPLPGARILQFLLICQRRHWIL
jgi:hypothetical protein